MTKILFPLQNALFAGCWVWVVLLQEDIEEVKAEVKPEVKPEVKAEVMPHGKLEVKPEVKPEVEAIALWHGSHHCTCGNGSVRNQAITTAAI